MRFDWDILDSLLRKTLSDFSMAGVSVSVRDGEKEYHSASGLSNIEAGISSSPDTVYGIASSSKAFTATGIGILADRGLLDLDDTVIKHLPDFRMYDPYVTENLTIRDILCHRCGLPRHDFMLELRADDGPEEIVHALRCLKPAHPFRYRFNYQNHMFGLAAFLVEKISGESFEDFITENIFRPLGMDSSYVFGDRLADDTPVKSVPYSFSSGKFTRVPWNYGHPDTGAGCVYSSTRDMLKWLRFRIKGDERLLSDSMRRELQSPQMLIKPGELTAFDCPEKTSSAYGMGWLIESYQGFTIIHHSGAINGYRSGQLFVPEKDIAISILTNSASTDGKDALLYTLLDLLLGLPDGNWTARYKKAAAALTEGFEKRKAHWKAAAESTASNAFSPEEYAGRYRDPGYGELVLTSSGDSLTALVNKAEYPLIHLGRDRFVLVFDRWLEAFDIVFARDAAGRISGVDVFCEPALQDDPVRFEPIGGR